MRRARDDDVVDDPNKPSMKTLEMFTLFHSMSALNKFKWLLTANKESYQYITKNAYWGLYIENEFKMSHDWIKEQSRRFPNLNLRWLYFAFTVVEKSTNGTWLSVDAKPKYDSEMHPIVLNIIMVDYSNRKDFANARFNVRILRKDYSRGPLKFSLDEIKKYITDYKDEEIRDDYIDFMCKTNHIVWIIYAIYAMGYNFELFDLDGQDRKSYFVRDSICAECLSEAKYKCGTCETIQYCSAVCQKSGWINGHKNECF